MTISVGNTSSNHRFSGDMLVFRGVAEFWISKLRNVSWLQSFKRAELEPKPIKKSSKVTKGEHRRPCLSEKNEGSYLEDHPRICKWLITRLLSKSPNWGCSSYKWPKFGLEMVVTNYLLTGMILQVGNIYISLYRYYESPECAPKLIHTILRSLRQDLV